MSDVFSRLVARARDDAPRVRPVIAPRFAPRTAPLPLEELDVEVEARQVRGAQHDATPRTDRERSSTSDAVDAPAPPTTLQVERERPSVSAAAASPRTPAAADDPFQPAPLTLERTIERIFQTRSERVEEALAPRPVAAPPPPLHPADLAVLRPAEPSTSATRRDPSSAPREDAAPLAVSPRPDHEPEAIRISIGRIDVRAISPSPALVASPRPRSLPLGLDDYLRRRNEER